VGHRERAVGSPALGVHAALRDHLAVEMGELLDQPDVLQQGRAARTGGHDVVLSATGAPVALVNRSVLDMMGS